MSEAKPTFDLDSIFTDTPVKIQLAYTEIVVTPLIKSTNFHQYSFRLAEDADKLYPPNPYLVLTVRPGSHQLELFFVRPKST